MFIVKYYEVEKSNFWNANKNPNKNNLSIYTQKVININFNKYTKVIN